MPSTARGRTRPLRSRPGSTSRSGRARSAAPPARTRRGSRAECRAPDRRWRRPVSERADPPRGPPRRATRTPGGRPRAPMSERDASQLAARRASEPSAATQKNSSVKPALGRRASLWAGAGTWSALPAARSHTERGLAAARRLLGLRLRARTASLRCSATFLRVTSLAERWRRARCAPRSTAFRPAGWRTSDAAGCCVPGCGAVGRLRRGRRRRCRRRRLPRRRRTTRGVLP